MRVFRWTSIKKVSEYDIDIPIFDDDTNGTVIAKIALDIHRQEVTKAAASTSTPGPDISIIPYVWANNAHHSIGFNLGSFKAPLNPWDEDIPDAPERYNLETLADVIWSPHKTLNIIFINDVPDAIKAHPAYFPIRTKIPDTYDKILGEARALKAVWDAADQAQSKDVMFRRITFTGTVSRVDMVECMKRLKTSAKLVPFNQFIVDDTKILYKVNKKHNLSQGLMNQLMAFDRVPKLQGVVAIVPMSKHDRERHVYAKVVLDTTGKLTIFYKIDSKVTITWLEIREHNKTIKNWLGDSVKLRVSALSARARLITKRDRNNIADVSARASQFPAIFHLEKPAFKGSVEIVYKRSDNYKSNLDIVDNISSQFQTGIPEAEVIENLVSYTGMTLETAQDWIQQYYAGLENDNLDPKKRPKKRFMSTGCLITITQDKQGLNLNFENLGSLNELKQALHWVSGIVSTVPTVAPVPPAKIKPQAPVKQPPLRPAIVPVTPPTSSDSSSSNSGALHMRMNRFDSGDSDGGAAGKENNGYFLGRLEKADLDVFEVSRLDKRGNKKSYSRLCSVTNFRQPVVVDKVKMASLKSQGYDKAIHDSLLYRDNHYFCPALWCPKSLLPVTLDQLVSVNGKNVCPGEFGEEPIHMYKDEFWFNDPKLPRYIGFLDKQLSDKGLCMPCCMKTPLLNSPSAVKKQKLAKCMGPPVLNGSPSASASASVILPVRVKVKSQSKTPAHTSPVPTPTPMPESKHEDHFILGAAAPIPVGRYGTVPEDIHAAVYPGSPYDSCAVALNSSACIVRLGIHHGNDSFLSAIAACLNLPDKHTLISVIKKKLDPVTFMSLDNGNVLQSYINGSSGSRYKEALQWFTRHNNVNMFKGDNNKKRIELIYRSYIAFIEALKSQDVKHEDVMVDLVATLGVTLVVAQKVGDSVQVSCPSRMDTLNPVIAVIKESPFYEPLIIKIK